MAKDVAASELAARRPVSAMPLGDLALLAAVCLAWGANNVIAKVMVAGIGAPPMFYNCIRFLVVALAVGRWLWPPPDKVWRLVVLGWLMGAANFALLFEGLRTASPSAAAVVGQLSVPLTTGLSVLLLNERVRLRRALGALITLAGVLIVMWDPRGFSLSAGLLWVAASALSGAFGAIMVKRMASVRPLQFQAWVAVSSFFPLALLSAVFEHGQGAVLAHAFWPFVGGVLFAGLLSSVFGHTAYYGLIQRHDAGLLQPLTLMAPLATIGLGVLVTHDRIDLRMALGAAIALFGALMVAARPVPMMTRPLLKGRAAR
jgi:drug/metabolite transporter (DMT)-like permease